MPEIRVNPMLIPPVLQSRRLVLGVNGARVESEAVALECSLGYDVPLVAHDSAEALDILLECPDSALPAALGSDSSEPRQLGLAVRGIMLFRTPERTPFNGRLRPPIANLLGGQHEAARGLTGLSLHDLAQCFESPGLDCELGLAQHGMQQEGPGPLRYAGILVQKLVEGLDHGFEGIGSPGNLMTCLNGGRPVGEIIAFDELFRMSMHSEMTEVTSSRGEVLRTFYGTLGLRLRMLLEHLASGREIFVFQHPNVKSMAYVRPVLDILRDYAPNALLSVTENPDQPSGSVRQLEPDPFRAFIAAFAPIDRIPELDLQSWISICTNTYRLWREGEQAS
jgi:hypothetical protein